MGRDGERKSERDGTREREGNRERKTRIVSMCSQFVVGMAERMG